MGGSGPERWSGGGARNHPRRPDGLTGIDTGHPPLGYPLYPSHSTQAGPWRQQSLLLSHSEASS